MSRDIFQRLFLEFDKEDKEEVLELIKKTFGTSFKIIDEDIEFYNLEDYGKEYLEEDLEELKEICDYISLSEYEYIEDRGFVWEREDDDELDKIVRKKLRQIKKKNGN